MNRLPLHSAISEYAGLDPARFHMPGHKGRLSPLDVTEITGTDDLHAPGDAILESERLCAEAVGAADAFFLVNGSTAGNLAMLFGVGVGKRILLGRNCHKSVINSVALAGQYAVPLFPDENGLYSAEAVAEALEKQPCDAVFITSPTYRGWVSPIDEIAEAAHSHGALLLVDAAHGAHFAFSELLPPVPSAADMWCISTHKTLNALTQTALLLTGKSCPFTRDQVQRALNMFQSTSPSYEFMLSIESSVLRPADWDAHAARVLALRERLEGIEGLKLIGSAERRMADVTRLNIAMSGMNGYEICEALEKCRVYPEMADRECVTLITSPADPGEWYDRLISALRGLCGSAGNAPAFDKRTVFAGEQVMSVRSAVTGESESVLLSSAEGRICAQAVGCYPPGVAALFPGERIGRDSIAYLIEEAACGASIFGMSYGRILVVSEKHE